MHLIDIYGINNINAFGDLTFQAKANTSSFLDASNFGDHSFFSYLLADSLSNQQTFGDPITSFTLRPDSFFQNEFGSIYFSNKLDLFSIFNEQLFGDLSSGFLIHSQGIHSQEILGDSFLTSYLILNGFYDESFGNATFLFEHFLTSIETQEDLNEFLVIDYFSLLQGITWNVDQSIEISSSVFWDVGQGVQKWYRVQGCCLFTTAEGSGSGISGAFYPGGCEITNFESSDPKCIGAGGKQLFIQNILATSVRDVCRQLNQYNMKWKVCSIQVYSNPAGPAQDACNKLIDVPFSAYPECIEVSVEDVSVDIIFNDYVSFSFKYKGSGDLYLLGNSLYSGGTPLSAYNYIGSGLVQIGGTAFESSTWSDLRQVNIDFSFEIIYIEPILSSKPAVSNISGSIELINTICGNCNSMPSIIYSYSNLNRSYSISRFFKRNSIEFPSYFTMYYNSLLKSWVSNYQFYGIGDFGEEKWNFVSSWSCLNQKAEEYSSPYWSYSIFINRSYGSVDLDTRLSVTFPPTELCRLIDNLSNNFSFNLNVRTFYVENSLIDTTDYVVMKDNLGIFKDETWLSNPWFSVNLSRNVLLPGLRTIDLLPLIP